MSEDKNKNDRIKCAPENAARETEDVLKTTSGSEKDVLSLRVKRGGGSFCSGLVLKRFKGSCGSLCREQCTGWSSSASAGRGADRRPGSTTGPPRTRGPFATSRSACPSLACLCRWTRARCSSGACRRHKKGETGEKKHVQIKPKCKNHRPEGVC